MNDKSKYLGFIACIALFVFLVTFPLTAFSQAKDKIRMGTAISLSGPYAAGAGMTTLPNYNMWVEEVNAKGGIMVKSLGKRLPVELITYDDKSDIGTNVKLLEKLILEDKVDLVLPPWSTAMHFAVAPVVSKHGYPIMGVTTGSQKMVDKIHEIPYFFQVLNMPRQQAPALVEILVEVGVKRVAVIYVADLHGIEWTAELVPAMGIAGLDLVKYKSYPLGIKDMSLLIKEAKAANVDAFIAFTYPPESMLLTKQAIELEFNPKALYVGIGAQFPTYRDAFGVNAVEGIMSQGVWNPKVPYAGAREYFDRHVKRWKKEPDRSGSAMVYSTMQVLEQAIDKVGSLDRKQIRDVIAKETFPTVMGPVKFVNQVLHEHPGHIGQWRNGEFEVVGPKEKRTAGAPLFPKPPWPKK